MYPCLRCCDMWWEFCFGSACAYNGSLMSSVPNRWTLAAAAVAMQMCLGIIYAWAVFRTPLEQAYGWTKTMSIAPYRWSILFFTLAMIVAGFWQDRKGPR